MYWEREPVSPAVRIVCTSLNVHRLGLTKFPEEFLDSGNPYGRNFLSVTPVHPEVTPRNWITIPRETWVVW